MKDAVANACLIWLVGRQSLGNKILKLRNSIPLRGSTQKGSFLMRGIYNAVFFISEVYSLQLLLTKQSQLFFKNSTKVQSDYCRVLSQHSWALS